MLASSSKGRAAADNRHSHINPASIQSGLSREGVAV